MYMYTMPIIDTISFTQLRTDTKRLEALLTAKKPVALLKGSRILGHIIPPTAQVTRESEVPLFLKGVNLGGNYKISLVKRKDFYE